MGQKRVAFFFLSVLFLVGLSFFVFADDVNTSLVIPNAPPTLLSPIPNQSWAQDQNLSNAFDLDDYFQDMNGDAITYWVVSPENVTVSVDGNHVVSFFPLRGFVGVDTVQFIAGDGSANTTSNVVYLNVGVDTTPPQWSSLGRTPTTAYQNTFVNFSAVWRDDFQLKEYVFYLSQTGENTSATLFSGTQNVSRARVQMSSSAGTNLIWYFCARDTNLNTNCTTPQNFTLASPPGGATGSSSSSSSSGGGGTGGGGTSVGSQFFGSVFGERSKVVSNFSVDPSFFKLSLKQGGKETRILTITNTYEENLTFTFLVKDISSFVLFSDDSVIIAPDQSKTITLDFAVPSTMLVGEYNGVITVLAPGGSLDVPVVLDVNALAFSFEVDATVLEKSKRVRSTNPVIANITLFNLQDIPPDNVTLFYALKDLQGTIYDSFEETVSLVDRFSFERSLHLTEDASPGTYLFYVEARYDDFVAIDSDLFEYGARFDFGAIFKFGSLIVLMIVLSGLALFLFLGYRREREKERLLNLYLMLNEMKQLISEGKTDKAVDLYIRIKSIYGEPVSKTVLDNKTALKEEITQLSQRLKKEVSQVDETTQKEITSSVNAKAPTSVSSDSPPAAQKTVSSASLTTSPKETPASSTKSVPEKKPDEKS